MMLIDSAAPVPSPSRICRSKSGHQAELVEHHLVPDLDAHVARQDVVDALVAEAHRGKRRGGADEAVHDDRHAVRRAAEEDAGHGGDLEAAHLGQHVDGSPRVGLVHGQRLLDDGDLGRQRLGADAGAAAGDASRRARR